MSYSFEEAKIVWNKLSLLDIHSNKHHLKAGRIEETSILCKSKPLQIVLDEELIGIHIIEKKAELIKKINPQFIILKPSLKGGFES